MKIKNKSFLVLLCFFVFMIICYIVGIQYIMKNLEADQVTDGESNKAYVAIITKSTTSNFWKEVYSGASAGATEYNLNITFDGPDNEEDYETQNEMILQAAEDGADVIVLSAVDYNANATVVDEVSKMGVKIISIDSSVNSDAVICEISTDNYEAGYMAGEAALEVEQETLYIGIVNFDENSANGQEREEGFRVCVLEDERVVFIETINVNSTTADAIEGTKELLETYPEINVIATFNEWTSLGVGYAIEELGKEDSIHVVAFDNNSISVGMLESGAVDALIVQNPFAMGYLGVEYAYNLIYNISLGETVIDTATTLVTRENMYEEENQRVLFPFYE